MSRFRLTLSQLMTEGGADPALNVFYYESSGGTSANALANAFDTTVLPDIANVQSNTITYQFIKVEDLDDLGNFEELIPSTATGTGGGGVDVLPYFMAWSFQYVRATHASRHGWKRFTGLEEGMLSGSVPSAAMLALLNTLAITLESHLPAFPTGWDPKIARRPPPGGNMSQTVLFPVSQVVYRKVTTQNTRKR